jgi:hypothetical protein
MVGKYFGDAIVGGFVPFLSFFFFVDGRLNQNLQACLFILNFIHACRLVVHFLKLTFMFIKNNMVYYF